MLCCAIKSSNFCIHAAAEDVQGEKVYWEFLLNVKPPLGPGDLSSWAVLVLTHRCQWSTCCKFCSLDYPVSQIFPELHKWKDLPNHWLESPSHHVPLIMCSWAQKALLLSLKPLKWVTGATWPCVSVASKSPRTHESSFRVVATWEHKSLSH